MRFEYSNNLGRAKCKKCKVAFKPNELRIVIPSFYGAGKDFLSGNFHLEHYQQKNAKPVPLSEMDGALIGINESDKQTVQDFIVQCNQTWDKLYSKKRTFHTVGGERLLEKKVVKSNLVGPFPAEIWEMIILFNPTKQMISSFALVSTEMYHVTKNPYIWGEIVKGYPDLKAIEEAKTLITSLMRLSKTDVEIDNRMIMMEIWNKECVFCDSLKMTSYVTPLNGHLCEKCRWKKQPYYDLIYKTQIKKDFNMTDKEMKSLIAQKEPTSRQGATKKESYLYRDCLEFGRKKRLEVLKMTHPEYKSLGDIYRLDVHSKDRLFVEFDCNGEDGLFACQSCKKKHFGMKDRINSDDPFVIVFRVKEIPEHCRASRGEEHFKCCYSHPTSREGDQFIVRIPLYRLKYVH